MTWARRSLRPLIVGLMLAGGTYLCTIPLSRPSSLQIHTILLGGIGAVYLGFAIADGRMKIVILEAFGASIFLGIAVAGMIVNPRILVTGYFGHGLWDIAHHNSRVPNSFAGWYVPFCTIYDWAVGGYLLFLI